MMAGAVMLRGRRLLAAASDRQIWLVILVVAALPRLAGAFIAFFHHPDEVWQYVEPAYGLLTGHAVRTWEYRDGIRGWLLPELIAGPLWLAREATGDPAAAVTFIRMLFAVASLSIVVAGMAMAAHVSRLHAVTTGLVLATSFELVFFASRPLSEVAATDLLVVAAALLTAVDEKRDFRRLVLVGALLGFAFLLRFQLAPMIGILALLTLQTRWRAWGAALLGGIVALVIGGIADLAQGNIPLQWVIENVRLNLVAQRSERYGVEPWYWYLTNQVALWSVLTPAMLALIALGARRRPVLILVAAALTNVAFHSIVPHKEYRFVFPSVALLLVAAGIGSGDVLTWARYGRARTFAVAGLILFWFGVSAAGALTPAGRTRFKGAPQMAMWRSIHAKPRLCGVASWRSGEHTATSLAFIDRPVPFYMFDEDDADRALRANLRAFDLVIASRRRGATLAPDGYRLRACFSQRSERRAGITDNKFCTFERAGGCSAGDAAYLENNVRIRLGE